MQLGLNRDRTADCIAIPRSENSDYGFVGIDRVFEMDLSLVGKDVAGLVDSLRGQEMWPFGEGLAVQRVLVWWGVIDVAAPTV